ELQQQSIEEPAPAELRFTELGVEIVVVEHELLSEQLEEPADEKEQVRRIAGVNHVEPASEENPEGKRKGAGDSDAVLQRVACRTRRFERQAVAIDVDVVDRLEPLFAPLPGRADDRDD